MKHYTILIISYWLMNSVSHAEITLDGSLGTAATLTGPNYRIEASQGRQIGTNLFHSFGLFNLSNKESATFSGPADITNIIGRVTGSQASTIDGVLKSEIRGANLYLLNPHGIFFGPHASLNLSGSLYLSTADYLRLADGYIFSTDMAVSPLLSVAAPAAFGFLDNHHGDITVNGSELALPNNKNLSLIGGNIHVKHGGILSAPQGTIQLASIQGTGDVPVNDITTTTASSFGDITLEELAYIDTSGRQNGGSVLIKGGQFFMREAAIQSFTNTDKGHIQIHASGDLEIADGSLIQSSTRDTQAGDISLNGQRVKITNNSQVLNFALGTGQTGDIIINGTESVHVEQNGVVSTDIGKTGRLAGDIRINTQRLAVMHGGEISSLSNAGTTGNITVQAQQVSVGSGSKIASASPNNSGHVVITVSGDTYLSDSGTIGTVTRDGQAGHVTLTTGDMVVTNNAAVSSTALGKGRAGAVNVQAGHHRVTVDHGGKIVSSSDAGASSSVTINAGQLTVGANGKVISSAHDDSGPVIVSVSGDVKITAGIIGTGTLAGHAGYLQLNVGRLILDATGSLSSAAEGPGQAGAIDIHANQAVTITGKSHVVNSKGQNAPLTIQSPVITVTGGGSLQTIDNPLIIQAQQLNLSQGEMIITGTTANTLLIQVQGPVTVTDNSHIGYKTAGRGGGITLTAATVALDNGGKISSSGTDNQILITADQKLQLSNAAEMGSDGGGITVKTPQLTIDNSVISNNSGLNAATNQIVISTDRLVLTQGGRIGTETRTAQTGGSVQIYAAQSVSLAGRNTQNVPSSIVTQTFAAGPAGTLTIVSPVVQLSTGATISADTQGKGSGGQIVIKTEDLTLDTGALISSNSLKDGPGGEVSLTASKSVTLSGTDHITNIAANALGSGNGGQITIITPSLTLTGKAAITADTAAAGQAGNITVTVDQLAMRNGAKISTSSHGSGSGGLLTVTGHHTVVIAGNGTDGQPSRLEADTVATADTGHGGHIVVITPSLLIDAGLIRSVAFDKGDAGNIALEVGQLSLHNGAQINASSQGRGHGGDVTVTATGAIDIVGQSATADGVINPSSISSGALGSGNGGTIRIVADTLNLDKRGTIQTLTRGDGKAGAIIVKVGDLRIMAGGDIDASNEGTGTGEGGNIDIIASRSTLITAETVAGEYFGGIYSASENTGKGGDVILTTGQLTLRDNGTISAQSSGGGHAGSLSITADQLLLRDGGAISAQSSGSGHAGSLSITADQLTLHNGGVISAESTGTGDAGKLSICLTGTLQMHDAAITTQAAHAGGGDIEIAADGRVYLKNSKITAKAGGLTAKDTGGNILLTNKEFLILDNSQILASAVAGNGGNINLTSAQFVPSGSSIVDASSQLGVDGGIQINSPDRNISGSLTVLPTVFFDAASLFRNQCLRNSWENRSRFKVLWARPVSSAHYDWQPAPILY